MTNNPPTVAQYCEAASGKWKAWQEYKASTRFRGKYLEVRSAIAHSAFLVLQTNYKIKISGLEPL